MHSPLATTAVLLLSQLAFAPMAQAQSSFQFPDFSDVSLLTLNGAATQNSADLVLVNGTNQTASTWFTTPQAVTSGFETSFTFRINAAGTRGEGLAFVIHGDPRGATAVGGDVWGLGYGSGLSGGALTNSLALEIDISREGFLNDVAALEVGLHSQGVLGNSENEGAALARAEPTTNLADGQPHTMFVRYTPGMVEVFLDGDDVPLLSTPFMFETGGPLLGGGSVGGVDLPTGEAFVGFTAATNSGESQTARIDFWSWQSLQSPVGCYEGTIGTDVLFISGDNGGFFRRAVVNTGEPFSIDLIPPAGVAVAPIALFGTVGVADETTVVQLPGFGEFCFGNLFPFSVGSATAPTSLQIPDGILNLPFTLTLQGAMGVDPGNPGALSLTNAIVLDVVVAPAPGIISVTPLSAQPGQDISITGSDFSQSAAVEIAGVPAVVTAVSETSITVTMPANVPCDSTIAVINPDGQQATNEFNPTPMINSNTLQGSSSGGQLVVVLGMGLSPGSTLTIGGVSASITASTSTVLVGTVPPGSPGPVPLILTTPGGCSSMLTYTYL